MSALDASFEYKFDKIISKNILYLYIYRIDISLFDPFYCKTRDLGNNPNVYSFCDYFFKNISTKYQGLYILFDS